MQSPKQSDHFWTEVQKISDSLSSDIYLPTDIEAHLQRAPVEHHQYQSYPRKLRDALDLADNLFPPDNDVQNADDSFVELDKHLKIIEDKLQSIVFSLEQSSAAVRDSADSLANARDHVVHASHATKHISDFVDALRLPDNIHETVAYSNPHSNEFKHALAANSRVLTLCDAQRDAPTIQEILPSATSIRDVAIRRICERLRESFELMKEPSSSFTILRDTLLLQQRPLIDFLKDHGRVSFDWLTQEYVKVAKLAFGVQAHLNYDNLSSCGTSNMKPSTDSPFVGSNATKFLSSLWDYSSSYTKPRVPRVHGHKISRSDSAEQRESMEQMKEGLSHLSNECEEVLRSALDPPLTTAEVQLMKNPSSFSFSVISRQLISFFLKYERSESFFLTELFGDEGEVFLAEILSSKENPLLECLELSCQSLESTLEIEQLCLSLYVCRRMRENIKTYQELDHRIAFCVIAERFMQTRFASCVDSKSTLARELLLKEIDSETTSVKSNRDVTWFSIFVARLLEVVRQGDEWISSRDMGHSLRRRLSSSVGSVVSLPNLMEASNVIAESGIKLYMRFLVRFSFAIDTCMSLQKGKLNCTEDIRKEVEDQLLGACDVYAKDFENSRLQELSQLESSSATAPLDECSQLLAVWREKRSDIEHFVREDLKFLQNDPIGAVYKDEAVRHILKSLRLRTEAVKLTVSSHHPELSLTWNF